MNSLEIEIDTGNVVLRGNLTSQANPYALVIFSHGSGSSRFSPRNRYVAEVLNDAGMSTLLVDLLTIQEDTVFENRFNIELLTDRLVDVTNYFINDELKRFKHIGYFGASTGAASALMAASRLPNEIAAIVSRGGRPDLAVQALRIVKAPTLLVVGSKDEQVLELNEMAFSLLHCEKKLEVIPGATHLFEETGTLEMVSKIAAEWFMNHFNEKST